MHASVPMCTRTTHGLANTALLQGVNRYFDKTKADMMTQRLAIHARPLRSSNVHHVGDNFPRATAPSHLAGKGRSASGAQPGALGLFVGARSSTNRAGNEATLWAMKEAEIEQGIIQVACLKFERIVYLAGRFFFFSFPRNCRIVQIPNWT